PASYVNFLMFSNGGHPELNTFSFDNRGRTRSWAINDFFHISDDLESTESVVWNYEHRWSGAPRKMLPIAGDGVGNLICLDLSDEAYGEVVLWIHDPPDPPLLRTGLSLEDMIDCLEKNPNYI